MKASIANPLGKPTPGDKYFGLETYIRFYGIEDGYETEEREDAEIPIIQDKRLPATKQNLAKRKFPYIDTLDHMGPALVCAMHDLTSRVFEYLEITSTMVVDKRVNYIQRLLRGLSLKKYKIDLAECKESENSSAGDQWALGATKDVTMDKLWTCTKLDGVDASGYVYLGADMCLNFKKDIWLYLRKSMWKKHQSVFQDHVKYIHNDIVKPFRVGIL